MNSIYHKPPFLYDLTGNLISRERGKNEANRKVEYVFRN
jgi:hypothetical protein